jgi:peptidoglycan/LPS O-acetylase OafA/YrhL
VVGMLDSRVVAGVGLVSYSLFLAHAPLIDWLQAHNATFGGHSGFTLTLLVVFAASLAVATASYHMVERPALQWRARAPRATANARAG